VDAPIEAGADGEGAGLGVPVDAGEHVFRSSREYVGS
jgi:hypothetical protein